MTTKQIAQKLVDYCREGEFEKAQKELFSKDVVSIEPEASQGFDKETKGLDKIIEKGHKFQSMVEEAHGVTVSDPLISGNSIAFVLDMDMKMKGRNREKMSELCVYHVEDGKIVSEQFYM